MQVTELNITNFVKTAQTTAIPRWTFLLGMKYTNNAGVAQEYGPTTHTWPNDLAGIPDDYVKKVMTKVIADKARVQIGEMTWEDALNGW